MARPATTNRKSMASASRVVINGRRRTLPALCLLLIGASVPAQQPRPRDPLEQRIDKALAFLKTQQEADGAWLAGGTKSHAVTGLAVMAFLSAGHVPGEGPYADTIDKGLRWILRHQHANGLFEADPTTIFQMYNHGI